MNITRQSCRSLLLASIIIILLATIPINKTPDFGLAANAVSDTSDEGGIVIVSISTRYDRQLGSFHLFGEVQNNLIGRAAAQINLNATFFDSQGNSNSVLGVLSGSPYLNFLNPGEKSGFELMAYGELATMLANFSHYSVSATWDAIEKTRPGLLKLRVDRIFLDPCGSYHIEGSITNYGRNDTDNIIVSSAFYNERGQVVASAYARLVDNQEVLPSAFTAPFIFIIEKSTLSHLTYYSLNVHSADYSAFTDTNIDNNELSSLHENLLLTGRTPSIAVYSDSSLYHIGSNTIRIFGTVTSPSAKSEPVQGVAEPLVLLRILTTASYPLKILTAPLSANGSFSRTFDFVAPEGTEGEVYRIIASYKGTAAENTFSVDYDSNSEKCKDISSVNLQNIGWTSSANNDLNNDNSSHSSNEGKKINVGETVVFYAVAQNEYSRPQPIVTIFEVLDSEGVVVFLHLDTHVMDSLADDAYQASVPWSPDSIGSYNMKMFIISGLDQPRIMSSIVVQKLEVGK